MQVGLVAGGDLKSCRFNLHKVTLREPSPQGCGDTTARKEVRPAGGVGAGVPERWACWHIYLGRTTSWKGWHRARRSLWCAPKPRPAAAHKSRIVTVKVIASSLRKGNIVDLDGKLYVVLNAENFHPGKGTPTTQVDMRRISDGVKTQMRYKTTDQVERAHVEDHEFSYLYQDDDGFHFMNQENFDQVQVPTDVIGDQTVYLQEGMVVNLSVHEGVPVAIELPQKVTLEIVDTEPAMKGQTASGSFKPAKLGIIESLKQVHRGPRISFEYGSAHRYHVHNGVNAGRGVVTHLLGTIVWIQARNFPATLAKSIRHPR